MKSRILIRFTLLVGSVVSFASALILLISAGLPDRADYSGKMIAGIGRVAPEINSLAPPFEGSTITGSHLRLLDLRGETVILNFWATWCAPCITEMPLLQTFYEDSGIQIIGINLGEQPILVTQWVETNHLTFDILLDPQLTIAADYQIRGQPSTYIITADGIISHIFYGTVSMKALREAIGSQNESAPSQRSAG